MMFRRTNRMHVFAFALWMCCIVIVDGEVLRLDDTNFVEKTLDRTTFIKFFAPWCQQCQQMAPAWEKLADDFKSHDIALVAEVDCDSPGSENVCDEFDVTSFPSLYWGDVSSPEQYEGEMDYETLSAFAKEHITKPACTVKNLGHCTSEQQALIKKLQSMDESELEEMEFNAEKELMMLQASFDEELDKLSEKYDQLVDDFNKNVEKIRNESHYKWIQQILAQSDTRKAGANEEL